MTNDRSQNDKVNHSNRHKSGYTYIHDVCIFEYFLYVQFRPVSFIHITPHHTILCYYFVVIISLLHVVMCCDVYHYHKFSSIIIVINIIVIPIIIKHSLWLFETISQCYIRVTIIILKNCWEYKTMKYVFFLCSNGCR